MVYSQSHPSRTMAQIDFAVDAPKTITNKQSLMVELKMEYWHYQY